MRMKSHHYFWCLAKFVPNELFLTDLVEPVQVIQEKSIRLDPNTSMFMQNRQANQLTACAFIKIKLIGSDSQVNVIDSVLLQILSKCHFCDDNELKVRLICSFFEVFDPYLHEEGIFEWWFFEVHP